jgi:tetratricopeptide (TPR) repeat protein
MSLRVSNGGTVDFSRAIEKGVAATWRYHFRIPEFAYWLTLITAAAFLYTGGSQTEAIIWMLILGLSVIGIGRWHFHRSRSRGAVVVARFASRREDAGRAEQIQEIALTSLRDRLAPSEARKTHGIPAVVGTADRSYAAALRRRLRASQLVHGRVEARGGDTAAFARVVERISRSGDHYDPITKDRTPLKRSPADLFERYSSTQKLAAEEYPLEFALEIEAAMRGSGGQLALEMLDAERAEKLLREAIAVAPTSTSHQVDKLRANRALALLVLGRGAESLKLLRKRRQFPDPSPYLLRTLSILLRLARETLPTDEKKLADESAAVLRQAAETRSDPLLEETKYNLASTLRWGTTKAERREGTSLLEELDEKSSYYHRAWYLHRDLGWDYWHRGMDAKRTGRDDEAQTHFARSARHYRRALRRRPRFRLLEKDGGQRRVIVRYPPAAIMHAQAADAQLGAGHKRRANWQIRCWRRARAKLIKRSKEALEAADWQRAYEHAEWAASGQLDPEDITCRVYAAIALRQLGADEAAERTWDEARKKSAFALYARALVLADPKRFPLTSGVPGGEETDFDAVVAKFGEPGRHMFGF